MHTWLFLDQHKSEKHPPQCSEDPDNLCNTHVTFVLRYTLHLCDKAIWVGAQKSNSVFLLLTPLFSKQKDLLQFAVRPSVCPAAIPFNSSYTMDALIIKPTWMHTDVGNVFEIFLRLQVL